MERTVKPPTTETIRETISRLISTWARMSVRPIDGNQLTHFDSSEPVVIAHVNFEGAFGGAFSVLAQKGFMQALTKSLFGDEDDSDDRALIDATKELSNVLSGNLLTELYGIDTAFSLEPPQIQCKDVGTLALDKDERRLCFECDNHPMAFTFRLGDA